MPAPTIIVVYCCIIVSLKPQKCQRVSVLRTKELQLQGHRLVGWLEFLVLVCRPEMRQQWTLRPLLPWPIPTAHFPLSTFHFSLLLLQLLFLLLLPLLRNPGQKSPHWAYECSQLTARLVPLFSLKSSVLLLLVMSLLRHCAAYWLIEWPWKDLPSPRGENIDQIENWVSENWGMENAKAPPIALYFTLNVGF